jgi:uncharacterized protein YbjT (DUF2867 family)
MESGQKKAIVLGATGLVGSLLTRELMRDPAYSEILVFSRSALGMSHPKVREVRADLLALGELRQVFRADVVFCCVGTTRAKTPDKEAYRAIDYGIPVAAAHLCRQNGIPSFLVVSALGANPKSLFFYNRVKGEMEVEVLRCGVPHIHLLQPSLIGGNRGEARPGERLAQRLMHFMEPVLMGPLKKYRIIHPLAIARAMMYLAENPREEARIPSDRIRELGGTVESEAAL